MKQEPAPRTRRQSLVLDAQIWETAAYSGSADVRMHIQRGLLDLGDVLYAALGSKASARRCMTEWNQRDNAQNVFSRVRASGNNIEWCIYWKQPPRRVGIHFCGRIGRQRVAVSADVAGQILQMLAAEDRPVSTNMVEALVVMSDRRRASEPATP
jgi:hypothetical protein